MSRVAPTKGDLSFRKGDQSMVGNGDPVGVTAKVVQYILGAAKGRFGVDDPVLSEQWA